uniref:Uncharacterized protein n=1 Tax=Arion vulgaris TaxID=1028688 RepID=A0A0B6ZEL6_9EUPU
MFLTSLLFQMSTFYYTHYCFVRPYLNTLIIVSHYHINFLYSYHNAVGVTPNPMP